MSKRVILVGILVIAALTWLLWPQAGKKRLDTFYYLPSQTDAQQTIREIKSLAGHAPFVMENRLLDNYHRLCLSEFAGTNGQQNRKMKDLVMESASLFAATNGITAFMAVGYAECGKFIHAMKKVISDASKAGIPVVRYIYGNQDNPDIKTLAMSSGDFLNHAVAHGLAGKQMTKGDYFVARMLFLYRWSGFLRLTPAKAMQYLPKHCLQSSWGWIVERAQDIPGTKRMAILHLLERYEPNYPSGKVRLLLLLKNGRVGLAYRIWRAQVKSAATP